MSIGCQDKEAGRLFGEPRSGECGEWVTLYSLGLENDGHRLVYHITHHLVAH